MILQVGIDNRPCMRKPEAAQAAGTERIAAQDTTGVRQDRGHRRSLAHLPSHRGINDSGNKRASAFSFHLFTTVLVVQYEIKDPRGLRKAGTLRALCRTLRLASEWGSIGLINAINRQ